MKENQREIHLQCLELVCSLPLFVSGNMIQEQNGTGAKFV